MREEKHRGRGKSQGKGPGAGTQVTGWTKREGSTAAVEWVSGERRRDQTLRGLGRGRAVIRPPGARRKPWVRGEPLGVLVKEGFFTVQSLSCFQHFCDPWTVACQAPLFTGFPRWEYWSGLPFPSPGDFLGPGIEPAAPALAGGFFTTESPGEKGGLPSSSDFNGIPLAAEWKLDHRTQAWHLEEQRLTQGGMCPWEHEFS